MALLLLIYHLLVAESSESFRVPVHHSRTAVYIPFGVKLVEHLYDACRQHRVHGESRAAPVARRAQAFELLQNYAAILMRPVPGVLQELFASELRLVNAVGSQLCHHLGLGGDSRMVGARHPQSILARHARAPNKYILNSVIQHVAHVQHARNIGGRNHYHIRFTVVRLRMKQIMLHPVLIPSALHGMGVIFCCKFVYGHIDLIFQDAKVAKISQKAFFKSCQPCKKAVILR